MNVPSRFALSILLAAFLPAAKAAAQMKVTYDNTFYPAPAAKPVQAAAPVPVAAPVQPLQMEDVDQLPEFNGDLATYLSQNLRYPDSARTAKIQGIPILEFTVGAAGLLRDVRISISSGYALLDDEALRLFRQMESAPMWKPGMRNGRTVPVVYTLPVTFRL